MSHLALQATNSIAFKEWAAVCAALAGGRQTVIVRKGGIAEGPAGFRPEHAEFWLLPTHFHEQPDALRETDRQFFERAQADRAPADRIRIELYARVAEVIELADESRLQAIAGLHIYGESTLRERFHYRRPGLFVLATRIYRPQQPAEIHTWPELAGCRTWVDLPTPLSTATVAPVLSDEEFGERLAEMRNACGH